MFTKKCLIVGSLVLSIFTQSVFAAGNNPSAHAFNGERQNVISVVDSGVAQPGASESEVIELSSLPTVTPGQMEEGSAGAQPRQGLLAKLKGFFGGMTKKKFAAIAAATLILGGTAAYVAVKFEQPKCNTVYDPITKICSRDTGALVPQNPGEFQRGMYVSMWTDEIMRPTENPEFIHILGDTAKENKLLEFIDTNHIDALTIYNLGTIFDTKGMSEMLSDFIVRAKGHGVKEIIATGNSKMGFDIFADFNKRYPGRFDGMITELEFWNEKTPAKRDSTFNELVDLLKYMKGLGLQNVISGKNLKIATYFGVLNRLENLNATEVAESILSNTDRIYQHCYGAGDETSTHDPIDAYRDCKNKMAVWMPTRAKMGVSTEITPIFSAEGKDMYHIHGLPNEYYSGPFLLRNSVDAFEAGVRSEMAKDFDPALVRGNQWFQYSDLSYHLNHGKSATQPK